MRTRTLQRLLLSVMVTLCALDAASVVHARERVRSSPRLATLWNTLDNARVYRGFFLATRTKTTCSSARDGENGKSFSQIITDYSNTGARQAFRTLAGLDCVSPPGCGFQQYVADQDPAVAEEATWGVQEALNEIMAGQLLVANNLLIKGLQARFPGANDPSDPDQLTLLTRSGDTFKEGIDAAVEELRHHPQDLRSVPDPPPNPTFSFWVENTRQPAQGLGELVENEMYRFTDLVQRNGLANNAIGKRKFYFGNATPEGRADAVQALKGSAQATYLHTAVLASVQSERDFDINYGYELKRQVVDAERVFNDVNAGFNPLKLLGDFVPKQPVEHFLDVVNGPQGLLNTAITTERDTASFARSYDVDQNALVDELQSEQERYLDQIASLTGIAKVDTQYALAEPGERDRLLADAEKDLEHRPGELGDKQRLIEQAALDASLAAEEVRQIPEKIRYEEQRNAEVNHITTNFGYGIAALDLAYGIAGAIPQAVASAAGGTITALGSIVQGAIKGEETLLSTLENSEISGVNSGATVKNLLLQEVTAAIALQRAVLLVESRKAELEESRAVLQRAIRNFVSARTKFACAYYTNPAYRLQLDNSREDADQALEAAMVGSYFAAKALEYEWAERFSNPVRNLITGVDEAIGDATKFGPIIRAESAFAVRSAGATGAPAPSLATFMTALKLWDIKMRQLRSPAEQRGFVKPVSVRKQILGFTGGDEAFNRLAFRDFIAKHRVPGSNPNKPDLVFEFPIQIANELFFPHDPNLKIETIGVELRSSPGRSIRGSGDPGDAALVRLAMLDTSVVRTFRADLPDDPTQPRHDDLLPIKLDEGRTVSQSPFRALLQAPIDGFPTTTVQNTELQNFSPAVTRWVMTINASGGQTNQALRFENLDDIVITFTYKFGVPRSIAF